MNVTSKGIAIALAVVVVLGFFLFGISNPFGMSPDPVEEGAALGATTTTTNEGLMITEVQPGTGEEAVAGKTVAVHYTGRLTDGTTFDSSAGGQPISFVLGTGRVIPGWEQGIAGMKVGGKRVLTIPPELGYGAAGVPGVIPPNATLVFDVELVGVQ